MTAVETSSESGRPSKAVAPMLPLALLESIRVHDRPREVLEDEDLSASLPRRLGLTGVVESQIRRYEEAARRNRNIPLDEVRDLFRLIRRRPDAEPILREAGAILARRHARRIPAAAVTALGILPGSATAAAVRRSARSLLRRISAGEEVKVAGWPVEIRIRGAVTAQVDPDGVACVLVASAIEELVSLYAHARPEVEHRDCAANGAARCVWSWTADNPGDDG